MFKDESHIISCLINRCNNKIFLKGKYIVFNFMFIKNGFNRSICYFIFKGMIFFIYWRYNMTFPYWKKVFVDAFDIWARWLWHSSSHEEVFYWKGVALQLYWNCTSAWVFSCIFAAYFQKTFSVEHLWMTASELRSLRNLQIFNWCTNCL